MNEIALASSQTTFLTSSGLDRVGPVLDDIQKQYHMLRALEQISLVTGGHVHLVPELGFMPALLGTDRQPVFLYRVMEAIDEYVDADKLRGTFPTLNYTQILASMAFLRKIAQTNITDIDVDEEEEKFEMNDPDFLEALTNAFNDKETVRVLSQPK